MTALVVLAAGASRRLGECKATVPIGPRSALEHILFHALEAGLEDPLVVAGADATRIQEHLARGPLAARVACVTHDGWEAGRTTSAARGAAERPHRDLCIATLDAPVVPASVYRALREEWSRRERPELGWLSPAHRTPSGLRHGHPFFVGRRLAERISGLPSGASLRDLRAEADPLWNLEVNSHSVLDHLDTPADLATIRERFGVG